MDISQSIGGTRNLVFQNRKWKLIKMLVSKSNSSISSPGKEVGLTSQNAILTSDFS